MLPRTIVSFLLAFVVLAGSSEAFAQPAYALPQQNVSSLTPLFKRVAVPARLLRLDGPDSLHVGEAGLFTAAANVESATLPLRIEWDFGDGAAAHSLAARHRFEAPGTYTVVFSVSNRHGATSDTLRVTVLPAVDTDSPSDAFSARDD